MIDGARNFARRGAPFTLVTGGKGGVGKTTLAVNLALELAREGRRVLLVDLDLGLANVDVLLRLSSARTLEDALDGLCRFEDCVVPGPHGSWILPASSGASRMATLDAPQRAKLFEGLSELAQQFDCLIGDSAAGIGADVLEFAARADCVLVVTTPDPAALADAYGLIKALDELARESDRDLPTPELVINFADGIAQAELVARKLGAVCERFLSRSPRFAGWMPRSRSIRESVSSQRPFALAAPRSLESACLRRLAERLQRLFPTNPFPTAELAASSLKG